MNYETSILLNKEFSFNYSISELIIGCSQLKELYSYNLKNNISYHEIFIETSMCFATIKKQVDKIIQGNVPSILKKTIKFQEEISGKNFCYSFTEKLFDIKDNKYVKNLKLSQDLNKSLIFEECKKIGGDFNKEGLSIAITSMYTTLNSFYNEFKDNNNRSEEYNFKLLNDKNILMFQAENYFILSKIPFIYYVLCIEDIINAFNIFVHNDIIFFVIEVFLMMTGIIIYFYFVILYGREISIVDFFNKCILHMILFE